ncbi:hypothetical protein KDM87_03445 [Undibacterium sp. FT147W]|uniref:Uncharacterized protein n=1 Tax=Undibacterium rivi TaxID=2828729 RepID=A0ABS5GYU3_9BURK|nr:hypothetical protein [Undibacterium rivi]MBR7791637.1 hypothetical protein [Undibacterium rivi]
MSNEKDSLKLIGVAASLATLSVPFLYIFGYAYDQGYLHGYGISNEFFARSIQEYLVLSFYALLWIAISVIDFATKNQGLFWGIGTCVFITGVAIRFVTLHHFDKRLKDFATACKQRRIFDYIFLPLITALITTSAPFFLIVLIAAVLLIPTMAYFKGENVAREQILKAKVCSSDSILSGDCVYLVENKKPIAYGIFVARSSTHLALFNNGKTSIFPLKEQIVEVVPKNLVPKPTPERIQREKSASPLP